MENKYKVYDKHIAFWGSEFSNFYPCYFTYKGITWASSEQAFMAEKAVLFNDYSSFLKIIDAKSPKEAKELGCKVKNFHAEKWYNISYKIMFTIVYEKFNQNKYLRDLLLSDEFEGKHFVEGSPIDGLWGVKIAWDDPKIDDEKNWQGENRLGKILDDVRERLQYYQK